MFGFRKVKREVYSSTILRKVYITIQFPVVSNFNVKAPLISDLFFNDFPRVSLGKNKGFQFSMSNIDNNPSLKALGENDTISLKSEDGQSELFFRNDRLEFTIEGKSYRSFEDNVKKIIDNLMELFTKIDVKHIENCSLRKINIIEYSYNDEIIPNRILEVLLNNAVVYNDDAFPDMSKISQNIHNVEFKDGEYLLNLKYGMNTLPFIEKKIGQLIVDYSINSEKVLEILNLSEEIELLNSELFNVFHWIFNENFKKTISNGN